MDSNFTAKIAAAATAYGLDQRTLTDLLEYLARHAATPKGQKAIKQYPDEFMRAGITAWRDQRAAFFTEVLENKTPNAKKWRAMIATEVWNNANGAAK